MRLYGENWSPGFLLIEVLVALAVFVVMVGAFSRFINVWLTADSDQRVRHNALALVCEVLESAAVGVSPENQAAVIKARQRPAEGCSMGHGFAGRRTNLCVDQLCVQQIWDVVPTWVGRLQAHECPINYRATAGAQVPQAGLSGGQLITVQVTG